MPNAFRSAKVLASLASVRSLRAKGQNPAISPPPHDRKMTKDLAFSREIDVAAPCLATLEDTD